MKKVFVFCMLIIGLNHVYADCPAHELKRNLNDAKDALVKECGNLKDKATKILASCKDGYHCNSVNKLEYAKTEFLFCWSEADGTYPGWTTFASCENALRQLSPYAKRIKKANEHYEHGRDAFNQFVRNNQ